MTFTLKPSCWPERVICLTAETTELVFALGAGDRIVGVSGYSVRPPEARQKEKVAAFTSIRIDKILELQPDLILGFSDLQKDIARELVQEGFNIFISNQRTLDEIANVILAVGRLLGLEDKAFKLRDQFLSEIDELAKKFHAYDYQPKVYFEEWDEPMISGIRWVSELIKRLGGQDVFEEKSFGKVAKDRFVGSEDVIAANPDIIIASWCGKKVQAEKIRQRSGWDRIEAVKRNQIYEIKSPDILAPGLSLIYGARKMAEIFGQVAQSSQLEKR